MLNIRKSKSTIQGSTQRYEIIREVIRPPWTTRKLAKLNMLSILYDNDSTTLQDNDHDMTDSSLPTNNKRGQLVIQLTQQKRTRNDLQVEHMQTKAYG
jgi:hypothetical protein